MGKCGGNEFVYFNIEFQNYFKIKHIISVYSVKSLTVGESS